MVPIAIGLNINWVAIGDREYHSYFNHECSLTLTVLPHDMTGTLGMKCERGTIVHTFHTKSTSHTHGEGITSRRTGTSNGVPHHMSYTFTLIWICGYR